MEFQDIYGLAYQKWCVGGDFNMIRRSDEKLGGTRLTLNMRYFDELIRDLKLFDPPLEMLLLLGQICKMFLFVRNWIDFCSHQRDSFFPHCIQEALLRWTSDHNPICLDTNLGVLRLSI